jgi:hypothetical protein
MKMTIVVENNHSPLRIGVVDYWMVVVIGCPFWLILAMDW